MFKIINKNQILINRGDIGIMDIFLNMEQLSIQLINKMLLVI